MKEHLSSSDTVYVLLGLEVLLKNHLGFIQKLTVLDCCSLSSLKPLQIVLLSYLLFPSKRDIICKGFLLLVFKGGWKCSPADLPVCEIAALQ